MKASDKNRAILAESIARSWREPEFRQKLTSNPKETLKDAGMDIPDDHEVEAFENTDNLIHAVLPEKSQMDSHNAAFDTAVSNLRNLPDNVEVRIMRDTEKKSHIVLPTAPAAAVAGEMTNAELEQVAGGKASTATYEAEVTATSVVQTEEVVTTTTEAQDVETTSTAVAEVEVALVPCFVT